MVDGTTRHDGAGRGEGTKGSSHESEGVDDAVTVLREARAELDRAADELERVTEELRERAAAVERLAGLTEALLDVMAEPAVVVGGDGRVAAVSRGATDEIPALSGGLGQPAASVLPDELAQAVTAFAEEGRGGTSVTDPASGPGSGSAEPWGDARLVRLPEGATLVVLR